MDSVHVEQIEAMGDEMIQDDAIAPLAVIGVAGSRNVSVRAVQLRTTSRRLPDCATNAFIFSRIWIVALSAGSGTEAGMRW